MSVFDELTSNALREHREHERETLKRVTDEALDLERYPEGEEERDTVIVDGHAIPVQKRRIGGTLSIRFRK